MKNQLKFAITSIFVFMLLALPALSFAAQDPSLLGLVTCKEKCDFNDLMILINKVINFIIFSLALPIAAIMFAYAGFKLVTSGGDTGARQTAKTIFTNTLIGLVFVVAAWLIINTVLSILGYNGGWIGFIKPTS